MNIDEKIFSRYDANLKIVKILGDLVVAYPDWRFQQILQNIDITSRDGKDLFYEESIDTLNEVLKNPIVRSIISD
jgi:hypothetical protein|nr:MAG TPA: Protein of unknown function (DUF1040) [Bacteriophage sp.]